MQGPGHRFLFHYVQGTGSCNSSSQRIHEFRLVTPSILCTGHRIHRFRAGFPSHEEGTGFTTVDIPHLHYAQGTGSCKPSPTTRVNLMHRAEDSLVPLGHSLDPMHRAQDSRVPRRFSNLCTVYRIYDSRHSSSMHRAVVPRVPPGHSLDPMHRAQFS